MLERKNAIEGSGVGEYTQPRRTRRKRTRRTRTGRPSAAWQVCTLIVNPRECWSRYCSWCNNFEEESEGSLNFFFCSKYRRRNVRGKGDLRMGSSSALFVYVRKQHAAFDPTVRRRIADSFYDVQFRSDVMSYDTAGKKSHSHVSRYSGTFGSDTVEWQSFKQLKSVPC